MRGAETVGLLKSLHSEATLAVLHLRFVCIPISLKIRLPKNKRLADSLYTLYIYIHILEFDLKEVEGFRYRVEDVKRAVTKVAITETIQKEVRGRTNENVSLVSNRSIILF